MAWIRQIALGEATGKLRELYDAAIKRAGRVFGILRVQSLAPDTLHASTEIYRAIMFGASPLSRRQREMLAVVTSRANRCFY
jgi:uncharacterized peroxidase-related enzyme